MPDPPAPPPPDDRKGGLDEVERALSVLGGRHPEQVRAEREAAEAAARRRRQLEGEMAAERAAARRRVLVWGVAALALAAAGFFTYRRVAARRALEAAVGVPMAPLEAAGFTPLPRSWTDSQVRAELDTADGTCYALVALPAGAKVHVDRPTGAADAVSGSIMCACGSEHVVATTPPGAGHALRVLSVAGASLGGPRALAFHFAHVPPVLPGAGACADDMLESWVQSGKLPPADLDASWLAAHPAMKEAGFVPVGAAAPNLPLVAVTAASPDAAAGAGSPASPDASDAGAATAAAARCFVAASDAPGDRLGLSGPRGLHPVDGARGAIAWCDSLNETLLVSRKGTGKVYVSAAPSRRLGGPLGLRELLQTASIAPVEVWEPDDERAALAADTLRASVVPDPKVRVADALLVAQAADARVLAFSIAGGRAYVPTDAPDAFFLCAPPMSAATPDTVCVQSRAMDWHLPGPDVIGGVAYGPLPFWMGALAGEKDPEVLGPEMQLLALSRALSRRGFDPTIIEGVTERPDGVEILGRSGEDAVVAVAVWPARPWVRPYTDGPSWELDGGPRVVPLAGGQRVVLHTDVRAPVGLDARRTVVFRHAH